MKITIIIVFLYLPLLTLGQNWALLGDWRWFNGSSSIGQAASFPASSGTPGGFPGARGQHAMAIDTTLNKIYLSGGNINSAGDKMNDLWEYDIATGIWTWLGGDNTPNIIGVYGVAGQFASTNKPGSRDAHSIVFRRRSIYLFGGNGRGATNQQGKGSGQFL
jgi:hypothetical protein